MKYLKLAGEWILESMISAGVWLLTTACIILMCALFILAGYFLLQMNCYVVNDMPMVCTMVDDHGILKELYYYITQ